MQAGGDDSHTQHKASGDKKLLLVGIPRPPGSIRSGLHLRRTGIRPSVSVHVGGDDSHSYTAGSERSESKE
jgi:hypothetical protein